MPGEASWSMGALGVGFATTLGATIGAIGTAVIGARAHKPEAASALVTAASQLTDRLLNRNADLAKDNHQIRTALSQLSDAVTRVDHEKPHVSDAGWDALYQANRAAQEIL